MARDLAMSQEQAAAVEAAQEDSDDEGRIDHLNQRAFEMHVDGWDFVSEQALAREYVMSAADVISII